MEVAISWIIDNYIEIFGAVAGIAYVFLEIRQNIWLWPVGIITSAVYMYVFFTGKLYADMSLQGYYLVISVAGWYWWYKGSGRRAQSSGQEGSNQGIPSREGPGVGLETGRLKITRLNLKTGIVLAIVFTGLFAIMWLILGKLTDSPVPAWDSFITSLSVIATWMLARKIYEHWFLWIIVNATATVLFLARDLYPTAILYLIYLVMSFAGLKTWKKSIL